MIFLPHFDYLVLMKKEFLVQALDFARNSDFFAFFAYLLLAI